MGFWQGFNEGLTQVMAEKTRKRELEEEREFRRQETAEARRAAREDFMLQLQESRRDNLIGLFGKKNQEKAEAQALVGKAQALLGRFGETDDPRVAALASDPKTAAELEDKLREVEVERARSGLELPPLQGEVLLDLLTVQDPNTGSIKPVNISIEDILEMDLSDRATYEQTMLALGQPTPRVDAKISPEAYRKPDPKVLEEGRKLFDQEVLRLANEELERVKDDPEAFAEISGLMEGFKEEGSAQRAKLLDSFGTLAYSNLVQMDNPYIQDIERDPQLMRYAQQYSVEIESLMTLLESPNATEEQKARARTLLSTKYGIQ